MDVWILVLVSIKWVFAQELGKEISGHVQVFMKWNYSFKQKTTHSNKKHQNQILPIVVKGQHSLLIRRFSFQWIL